MYFKAKKRTVVNSRKEGIWEEKGCIEKKFRHNKIPKKKKKK